MMSSYIYNRIVDAADERNLYRVTVEVYYRFVPAKLPLPAIVIANPISESTSNRTLTCVKQ